MEINYNPRKNGKFLCGVLVTHLLLSACMHESDSDQFSMHPGFAELIAKRSANKPSDEENKLLEKFRPALYIAENEEGPLDFYRDYIAAGCLTANTLKDKDCSVDRDTLNSVKNDPSAVFVHIPDDAKPHPVAYGSIDRINVVLPGTVPSEQRWTLLLYHFAFRKSGLSAKIGWLQNLCAEIFGDPQDWHQLDHYTHVAIALGPDLGPQAVMLQHHNYMRTFLVGADEPAFPATGKIAVDAAIRSNELYPHRAERAEHPAVGFITPNNIDFVVGEGSRPFLAAHDVTDGKIKVDYELQFLPPGDAYYTFLGSLGELRKLPGRDGPPGAFFNTLPELTSYENSMPFFFWTANDREYMELISNYFGGKPLTEIIALQRAKFAKALRDAN